LVSHCPAAIGRSTGNKGGVQREGESAGCKRLVHAGALAQALELNMRDWFTPDAENFFGRLTRNSIVAAIEEAKGVPAAPGWAKLKKAELAQLAAKQIVGTGWLPGPLREAPPIHSGSSIAEAESREAAE
jgi:ParB family chromosome partitioning protein